MDAHELGEERSIAMHRAIAERLALRPDLIAAASRRVDQWLDDGTVHREYALAWRNALALPTARLCELLVDTSEHARTLRTTSPFAGVLSARERWRIHRQVWQDHQQQRRADR